MFCFMGIAQTNFMGIAQTNWCFALPLSVRKTRSPKLKKNVSVPRLAELVTKEPAG